MKRAICSECGAILGQCASNCPEAPDGEAPAPVVPLAIMAQRLRTAQARFVEKHGVPPISPAAIQAAADRAHDERTEGFAKRPFRTNPHE